MKHAKVLLLVVPLIIFYIAGCNLFSFTNPIDSTSDYLAEGQDKYWEGDFAGAASDFARAKEQDPNNGDACWWHAKALLRSTGHTSISLITSLSDLDTQTDDLPFMDWSIDSANGLYQAMFDIDEDLRMIYYDSVYSAELDADAISLDYAASLSILGALMLRDTNVDSLINEDDVNFGAYFENGEFVIPDSVDSEWDQLSDDEQNELIDEVIYILENFADVIELLAEDVEGIDIDDLDEVIDLIIEELENLRP